MTFYSKVNVKIIKICRLLYGLLRLYFSRCKWFIFGTLIVCGLQFCIVGLTLETIVKVKIMSYFSVFNRPFLWDIGKQ